MSGLYRFHISFGMSEQEVRVARHPSESVPFFLLRMLAYGLHFEERLSFSPGVCAGRLPAIFTRSDPDPAVDRFGTWIDVGLPDRKKIARGLRQAERMVLYTHRNPRELFKALAETKTRKAEAFHVERGFLDGIAPTIDVASPRWSLALDGDTLTVNGLSTVRTRIYPS